MTVNRTTPAYRWKTLLLGDMARLDGSESYECSLAEGAWEVPGIEANKRALITTGPGALYAHSFQVVMRKGGAIIGSTAEIPGETDWAFRLRLRALVSAFAAEGIARIDTNHGGLLTQGYRDHEFTASAGFSAGSGVVASLSGSADASDFALWPCLIIGSGGVHELVHLEDGGPGWVRIETLVGTYSAGAQIIPVEWGVAGAFPRGPLRLAREPNAAGTVFTSGLEFAFVDEPEEIG